MLKKKVRVGGRSFNLGTLAAAVVILGAIGGCQIAGLEFKLRSAQVDPAALKSEILTNAPVMVP